MEKENILIVEEDESELDLEKVLEITDEALDGRLKIILENLTEASNLLRQGVDSTREEKDLLEDETFQKWIIANLIIERSEHDEEFKRLLYYMFEVCKGNIYELLLQYDLKISMDDENYSFELLINEPEE